MSKYQIIKSENVSEKCEQYIEIEIDVEEIGKHKSRALKELSQKADLPGFRKGHVPTKIIEERMGDAAILEEAINSWLKEAVPEILEKDAPGAIALPRVNIKKAVPGNPVNISMVIPLRPKLILPNYTEIAKAQNKKSDGPKLVTEKDVEDAILRLRQYSARAINQSAIGTPKDAELPPINDQFAEAVGGGKTVAELKERVKLDLTSENENQVREKNRLAIIESVLNQTEGSIPDILIEHELEKMETEFENDIKRTGIEIDAYLKKVSKTREDLIKEWKPSAEKRAKVNLILTEIKQKEKIEAPKEEVEHEVDHIIEHHKNADRHSVTNYVERMLGNQKVFEWLENQK